VNILSRPRLPDEKKFSLGLISYLDKRGDSKVSELIKHRKCEFIINRVDPFSNIHSLTIYFHVPIEKIESLKIRMKDKLLGACRMLMPFGDTYRVNDVLFTPILEDTPELTLMDELEKTSRAIHKDLRRIIFPEEIKDKSIEMSKIYTYLYCVKNALRLFIVNVARNNFGDEYMTKIYLNTDMKKKIRERKKDQEKKKWMSLRGDSDIYLLDIEDFSTIIQNNWSIFNSYFEDQNWIVKNIDEIASCRNPIALHISC